MKNIKVRTKLLIALGVILLINFITVLGGGFGMKSLHNHIEIFADKTLPNMQSSLEIDRNLQSECNELLLALQQSDVNQRQYYLDLADQNAKRNITLLENLRNSSSVDKRFIEQLDQYINNQKQYRIQFYDHAKQNNSFADEKAYHILLNDLIPLMSQESKLIKEIRIAQDELTDDRINAAENTYVTLHIILFCFMMFGFIFSVFIFRKLTRAIINPLEEIRNASVALSEGNFNSDISYESKDEFGETCKALKNSQQVLKMIIQDECLLLKTMANGDFNVHSKSPESYVGEFSPVLLSINRITTDLRSVIKNVNDGVDQVAEGAEQVSITAQALAQGATEQASAVEELSSTINEISVSAQENAESAERAMNLSRTAGKYVQDSANDIEKMVQAMDLISQASKKIEEIIDVIESIAFQTNLLALNAAVEAARAGNAGKGFAVVADEVRNLAVRTDESAKATKELISNSIDSVRNGEKIVQRIAILLEETQSAASTAVNEIDLITAKIESDANAISQIKEGIDQISAVVQTNSATSEESAAASEELSSQADMIKCLLSNFKV